MPRPSRRARAATAVPRSARQSASAHRAHASAATRGWCWRWPPCVGLGIVMVFNVSYFSGGRRFGDPLHFFRKHLVSIATRHRALRDHHRAWARTRFARARLSRCSSWRSVAMVAGARPRHRHRAQRRAALAAARPAHLPAVASWPSSRSCSTWRVRWRRQGERVRELLARHRPALPGGGDAGRALPARARLRHRGAAAASC